MMISYGEDLAYIHDAGFGLIARHVIPVIIDALRKRGFVRGLVVELGCGSGITAKGLTEAGYDVLGIDQSEAFLQLARQKAPLAQYHQASIFSVHIPSCIGVVAVGEIFNYLFDERNTLEVLQELFLRIYLALEPNGILLCDVAEPGRTPNGRIQINRSGPDWAVLSNNTEDPQERTLTREITSFRKVGDGYRRSEEIHHIRLYPHTEVFGILQQIGFEVELLRKYGDFDLPPHLIGFLARKGK